MFQSDGRHGRLNPPELSSGSRQPEQQQGRLLQRRDQGRAPQWTNFSVLTKFHLVERGSALFRSTDA